MKTSIIRKLRHLFQDFKALTARVSSRNGILDLKNPPELKNILQSWRVNNYFDFHVCLSICSSVRLSAHVCVWKLAPFPAVVWQIVTNKSCFVCVQSEKYASLVNLTPQLDCCCQGEAEVLILDFKTKWSELQVPSQTAPAKAKPRCVYSILKPRGQCSRCQVRLLLPRQSWGAYTQF